MMQDWIKWAEGIETKKCHARGHGAERDLNWGKGWISWLGKGWILMASFHKPRFVSCATWPAGLYSFEPDMIRFAAGPPSPGDQIVTSRIWLLISALSKGSSFLQKQAWVKLSLSRRRTSQLPFTNGIVVIAVTGNWTTWFAMNGVNGSVSTGISSSDHRAEPGSTWMMRLNRNTQARNQKDSVHRDTVDAVLSSWWAYWNFWKLAISAEYILHYPFMRTNHE
jgi:hypothetical protein